MKDLDKQIEAKDKVYKVILSCENRKQLEEAQNWIDGLCKIYERSKNESIKESSLNVLKGCSDLVYHRVREFDKKEGS